MALYIVTHTIHAAISLHPHTKPSELVVWRAGFAMNLRANNGALVNVMLFHTKSYFRVKNQAASIAAYPKSSHHANN